MRALIIDRPKHAELCDVPVPTMREEDVLIRVAYCGVCGTDMMIYGGVGSLIDAGRITYPIRIGHEWSGVVEKVGSAVTAFRPGDHVIGDSGVTCGKCEACRRGDYRNCRDIRSVGTVECWDGGFADYILLPERHVFRLPESVDLETAALIEPLTLSVKAIKTAEITADSRVLVLGTGAIGLGTVGLIKQVFGAKVICGGRNAAKMQRALELGADAVVNTEAADALEQILRIFPNGPDVVIEAAGAPQALRLGAAAMAKYGTLCVIGFFEQLLDGFDIDGFSMKAGKMCGITGDFGLPAVAAEMIGSAEKLDLKPLITRRITLEELPVVFGELHGKKNNEIKIMTKITGE